MSTQLKLPNDRLCDDKELDILRAAAVQNALVCGLVARYIRETEVIMVHPDNLATMLDSLSVMLSALTRIHPEAFRQEKEARYTEKGKVSQQTLTCVKSVLGEQSTQEEKEPALPLPASAGSFFVQGSGQA